MKWRRHDKGWVTLARLRHPWDPPFNSWLCSVLVSRDKSGCWMARRLTKPREDWGVAPGYSGRYHREPYRGYGRTREDAVRALQTACNNGWLEAGIWARRRA